ncbi:hypothetical protein HZI73_23060 [Vallitalea pronyensis]|uniref:Uncharacterized protein n=1 Tax=Vallitalea pronyensis TaxID=1348613 RepID=A0A8J8MP34_9FIRM|nr:hypothetical protein [Vallitalea pronyensis]QUI24994.1 hypothetical protein HZI73_23060 [Vallitalea pronyensis]
MKKYKWMTIILTGVLITSLAMVGYHVWASNRKQAGYDVDRDYVSKNQNNEGSTNADVGTDAGKDNTETNDELDEETVDNASEASTDNEQETTQDEEEGTQEQAAESEPHKGKDPIDKENEDNKPSGEDVEGAPDSESTDQSESDSEEPTKPDQNTVEKDYTGHGWVDDTINENREDIADADLEDGLSIGDKIDDDILLGYLDGGLTDEERVDLKEYLEVVLTPEEMSKLDALFSKYNYMFQ